MNLQEIQDTIHILLENDPTTPSDGDEDWNIRLNLINNLGIRSWERETDVKWNELWFEEEQGGTVASGQVLYDLPDDFKSMGRYVEFVDGDLVERVPILKTSKLDDTTAEQKAVFVTGNPREGFQLRLGWTPDASDPLVGRTLRYRYYKTAETLSRPADTPEMSDPMYIVHKVVARLHSMNFNTIGYQTNEDNASYIIQNMRTANEMGANEADDTVDGTNELSLL